MYFRFRWYRAILIWNRDLADISVGWEVEGVMTPKESVKSMLEVIDQLSIKDTGKFLTWRGEVRPEQRVDFRHIAEHDRNTRGEC